MICPNCGFTMDENMKFCPNCGTAAPSVADSSGAPDPFAAVPESQSPCAGNGAVRQGIPAPGFSDRVEHPEILAAVKKNRKIAKIFALFFVPLPLVGFTAYSLAGGKMALGEALRYGGILSAVFLIFALVSFIRERAQNTYDAQVIDQKIRQTTHHGNSGERDTVTEYVTVVKTTDGKKKKIVEREGGQLWARDYLNVGDRFRYHPQFHFPYELYDKSKAPYLVCVSCGTKNPVEADRCKKCHIPLLK